VVVNLPLARVVSHQIMQGAKMATLLLVRCALALALLLLTQSSSSEPATAAAVMLHVHPAGDDANDGSALSPLRTPSAARDRLRQLPSRGGAREVVLHAGTYPPLHLDAADSGTRQSPVVWTGRPGAVLSGGVPFPPSVFAPRSPGDQVLVANLSAVPGVPADLGPIVHGSGVRGCLNDRVELFVGPRRMVLARFPNLDVNSSDGKISWDFHCERLRQPQTASDSQHAARGSPVKHHWLPR
jgi:hypothetical protein